MNPSRFSSARWATLLGIALAFGLAAVASGLGFSGVAHAAPTPPTNPELVVSQTHLVWRNPVTTTFTLIPGQAWNSLYFEFLTEDPDVTALSISASTGTLNVGDPQVYHNLNFSLHVENPGTQAVTITLVTQASKIRNYSMSAELWGFSETPGLNWWDSWEVTAYKPTITSVTPTSAKEGEVITIRGVGFGYMEDHIDQGVVFGTTGNSCFPRNRGQVTSWTETEITAIVPNLTCPFVWPWNVNVSFQAGPRPVDWVYSNSPRFYPVPSAPEVASVEFKGTPQWETPEIINSGTITLTLDLNGHSMPSTEVDWGQVSVKLQDGSVYKVPNSWHWIGGNEFEWVQFIPETVTEIWIESAENIVWKDFGPWVIRPEGNGLLKIETVTTISFHLEGPVYQNWNGVYNPTWDWVLIAEPTWAAAQYPWLNTEVEILTTCNGHGDNHDGIFSWKGVRPGYKFGNGVERMWTDNETPSETVSWTASEAGWTVTGATLGPKCLEIGYDNHAALEISNSWPKVDETVTITATFTGRGSQQGNALIVYGFEVETVKTSPQISVTVGTSYQDEIPSLTIHQGTATWKNGPLVFVVTGKFQNVPNQHIIGLILDPGNDPNADNNWSALLIAQRFDFYLPLVTR